MDVEKQSLEDDLKNLGKNIESKIEINESSVISLILAFFMPPLGVFFKKGIGTSLLINILLTVFGFIPGIIHALYVILSKSE